jgi:hypothetical protein
MTFVPKKQDNGAQVTKMRVIKKLDPSNRGAITLAQQFGSSLICVRHRVDAEARFRFTTVELLVDKAEMIPRQPVLVKIRVDPKEFGLRSVVRAAGAQWDSKLGLWTMPKRVVTVLRLSHRIVKLK